MRGIRGGVVAAALAMAGGGAAAQGISIPAASLPEAAAALTAATGTQVLWQGAGDAVRTRPVRGAANAEAALGAMLEGTGLGWRRGGAGSVEVIRLAQAAPAGGAVELPQVDVTAVPGAPPTGVIGAPPPAYAGGQVATGQQVGLLGNRDVFNTPFSTQSLTGEFLRDQQVRTLTDALAANPVIRLANPRGSESQNFSARGFFLGSSDIAFNGFYGLTSSRQTELVGIERVEVFLGPNTLLNSLPPGGGVGGFINLVPSRAPDTPLARLTGTFISTGNVGAAIDAGRRFGQAGEFGVRINAVTRNGEGPIQGASDDFTAGTIALDYRGERTRLTLDAGISRQSLDRNVRPILVNPGFAVPPPPSNRNSYAQRWSYSDPRNRFVALRGEHDLADNVTVSVGYGHGRYDNEIFHPTDGRLLNARGDFLVSGSQLYPEYTETNAADAAVRARLHTGPVRHDLVISAVGNWRESGFFNTTFGPYTSNLYQPAVIGPRSTIGLRRDAARSGTREATSLAIADTLSILNDRVQLTLGGRLQQIRTENFDTVTGARTAIYDDSALTPAFAILLKPTERLSLYGNYIEALTEGPIAPQTAINAGQSLAPFSAEQMEIGAKYDFGRFAATAAVFQIDRPSSYLDPRTGRFGLNGDQRNRGIELQAFGEPRPGLRVLGGVTFLEAIQSKTQGGLNDGRRAAGVPRTQLTVGAELDVPWVQGLTATGRTTYTSSANIDLAASQSIPGWTTLDLGVRYGFQVNRQPVMARFNVENVTNENYWITRGGSGSGLIFLGAPRTYLFSVSTDF